MKLVTASAAELKTIPGVGKKMAAAIQIWQKEGRPLYTVEALIMRLTSFKKMNKPRDWALAYNKGLFECQELDGQLKAVDLEDEDDEEDPVMMKMNELQLSLEANASRIGLMQTDIAAQRDWQKVFESTRLKEIEEALHLARPAEDKEEAEEGVEETAAEQKTAEGADQTHQDPNSDQNSDQTEPVLKKEPLSVAELARIEHEKRIKSVDDVEAAHGKPKKIQELEARHLWAQQE